jgi:dTMP kinase
MRDSVRGRFIVFEGIDASGKSTQAKLLANWLEGQGRRVHLTSEPTSGPIGALIRQAFAGRIPLDDRVIAALFVADRLDHLTNDQDGLLELLATGVDVISDRYYLSSVAYHSSDVDVEWIINANTVSTSMLRPDATIYLDLNPSQAVSRLSSRREAPDKFEAHERLVSAYAAYAQAVEKWRRLDAINVVPADGPASAVFQGVVAVIEQLGILDSVGKPVDGTNDF